MSLSAFSSFSSISCSIIFIYLTNLVSIWSASASFYISKVLFYSPKSVFTLSKSSHVFHNANNSFSISLFLIFRPNSRSFLSFLAKSSSSCNRFLVDSNSDDKFFISIKCWSQIISSLFLLSCCFPILSFSLFSYT